MSILIDENTKVLVQGITGRDGAFHTHKMIEYGTNVIAGVTPAKAGQTVYNIPVYNTVKDAVENHQINCCIIYVPAKYASNALREAADQHIKLIVCITEGIPVIEMLKNYHYIRDRGSRLIGPNCPGLISPSKSKVGIMPATIHQKGNIGVISRSGTLTYEIVYHLTSYGLGQSTCIGIGGDPIIGSGFIDLLEMFEQDNETNSVVLIGEIGGEAEEKAAKYIHEKMSKPVVAFISGKTAPKGKRMGHAGAIISKGKGTAESKINAFKEANVPVADTPDQIPEILMTLLD
ncbi:succinate--CoA ligase subunit alpha [bacterium B13(2017)]|nr:succinate--CoA ligase subunit alpha [bacterium B13(2017)]